MSLNSAVLFWVGFATAAVHLNPAVAFVGTVPCFNSPAVVWRQFDLFPARTTCSSSAKTFANTPSLSAYSNDHIARSSRSFPSQCMMTMANAASESIRQVVEKPISQARFKETVHTIFEQIDMDGNGIIDMEEVQNLAGNFFFRASPSTSRHDVLEQC